ncbi:MAG: asparagine synthase (glutamine-hydrolyzing) [Planctomycetaceae bacterium]
MCGLAGIFERGGRRGSVDPLEPMLDAIRHRGPDDRGLWAQGPVALGQVRLAILDLGATAHQPMVTADGANALVYNGEVYNYAALRSELEREGERFSSSGDTEVVLRALARWRPERAVPRFDGMFAFAFWQGREGALWFGRDRLGIKPLYVAERDGALLFASEIKALLAHPAVARRPSPRALTELLVQGRLAGRRTPIEGVEAVEPGALWRVTAARTERRLYFHALERIDPARIVAATREDPERAVDRVAAALAESVTLHLASDVPLATMCSGGIDSSLVTAYARDTRPDLRAYVADVGGADSEWAQAERVGRHLGIPVTRVPVDAASYLRLWPVVSWHLDAPMFHASDAALLTVARRVREEGVRVLLTGEGADELFGGYIWQAGTYRLWRAFLSPLRRWRLSRVRRRREAAQFALGPLETDFGRREGTLRFRLLTLLDPDTELLGARFLRLLAPVEPPADRAFLAHCLEDLYRHLQSILQRHDRLGMAASIELRVPFLGSGMIDLGLHAPRRWKLHRGTSKWVLRRAAERRLPRQVVRAPKKGFPMPPAFGRGAESLLRGGLLAELMGWSPATLEELLRLAPHDGAGLRRLASIEIWGRVTLRRDSPEELGARLAATSGG